MQNSELFEGDIVGIPPDGGGFRRRMHDDVVDEDIFGKPVTAKF